MKNLKSKLAFILVLAMTATTALAAPVFAATTGVGDGTIEFAKGTGGIVDPPDDTDFSKISDAAIDFGTNEIATTNQVYNSIKYKQASATHGIGDYVHATAKNLDYAGVYVENPTLTGFTVMVKIGSFADSVTGAATMLGAVLTLTGDTAVQLTTSQPAGSTVFTQSVVLPTTSADALILSGPAACAAGGNWEGDLQVLGGTVTGIGQAKATMTWTFANV